MWLYFLSCTPTPEPIPEDPVIGILITPSDLIVPTGSNVQLKATGLTEERNSIDLTNSVAWNVEHYAIASIADGLDKEGLLTAQEAGSTRLYAQYNDIRSPYTQITVTEAELERLSINPNEINLVEGESIQVSATGYFSNGSSGDFTQQVRWITADGSIVQIPEAGKIKGISVGDTSIHAAYDQHESPDIAVEVQAYQENGKPDLVIDDANGYILDGTAYIDVKIKNKGSQSAFEFWVDAWGNRDTSPSEDEIGDDYRYVPYLTPNHYTILSFQFPYSAESGNAWIQIDTNNYVDEIRDSNNDHSLLIQQEQSTIYNDISLDYFDSGANSDGSRSYFVDITNNGTESIPLLFVDLYFDQRDQPVLGTDGDEYVTIEELYPGETKWADFLIYTPCSPCRSWVMVDSLDFIAESDESNNIGGPLSFP